MYGLGLCSYGYGYFKVFGFRLRLKKIIDCQRKRRSTKKIAFILIFGYKSNDLFAINHLFIGASDVRTIGYVALTLNCNSFVLGRG